MADWSVYTIMALALLFAITSIIGHAARWMTLF